VDIQEWEMNSQATKFGIYLNPQEHKVVRITSPYWIPEGPDWVYVTEEVNATLLKIRGIVRDRSLDSQPDNVTWGRIPLRD
jgi:hypothetical protein